MNVPQSSLPLWDLSSIYRGFEDPEYGEDAAAVSAGAARLLSLCSDVHSRDGDPGKWLAECITEYNGANDRFEKLESYAYARYSTATTDGETVKRLNKAEELSLELKKALVAFRTSLAAIGTLIPDITAGGTPLEKYGFFLREQLMLAEHQMTEREEGLASELSRSGGDAWSRLHSTLSSTLSEVWDDSTGETKTVVRLRALAFDESREVRRKAYEKELAAWKKAEIPLSFALNGVKGFAVALDRRRNYADSLERAVTLSRITGKTLDALIGAMERSLPSFRKYLRAKASRLGLDRLAFYDLFAPVGSASKTWTFPEAKSFIRDQFAGFSDELSEFAVSAFESEWIDSRPREGKVGGAYCTYFPIAKESRILCNFDGSFNAVSTVAHELGHAYHGMVLRDHDNALRSYPMPLAETASIFCESIVYNGAIEAAPENERLHIIEALLQDSTQVIVDILSRFYFEKTVFERRADNELTPEELCAVMTDAQERTYGDGLDVGFLHPYMWAVKGHYYNQDLSFYNFPYAFGQLFGLGLYGLFLREGRPFAAKYREILASTGSAGANEITAAAGFDIEESGFWEGALGVIERRIDEFCG